MDANAAAAKETKEKEGSTTDSQERNMRRSSRKTKIHNKTETANETTRTNGTDDTTEVATHKLNVDAAQNLCDRRQSRSRFYHQEGSLQVGNRLARLLSGVYEILTQVTLKVRGMLKTVGNAAGVRLKLRRVNVVQLDTTT